MAAVYEKVTSLADAALLEYLEREEGPVERALDVVVATPALSLPHFLSKIFSGKCAQRVAGSRARGGPWARTLSQFVVVPPTLRTVHGGCPAASQTAAACSLQVLVT